MWSYILGLLLSSITLAAPGDTTQLQLGSQTYPASRKISGNTSAYHCDDNYDTDIFTIDRIDMNHWPYDCHHPDYTTAITGVFEEAPGTGLTQRFDLWREEKHVQGWSDSLCNDFTIVQYSTEVCAAPFAYLDTIMLHIYTEHRGISGHAKNSTIRRKFYTPDGRRVLCYVMRAEFVDYDDCNGR